jgi:NAD(P)-dependent dehydrogenase (short-subunit alcohol dehydrogenase family)
VETALADLADLGQVDRLADDLSGRLDRLDVLVNNAGVAGGGRLDVATVDEWRWITEINLFGVVRGCRTFTPLFKRQGSGYIVNTASAAGLIHPPTMSSYNAVKAAVVALSETLQYELAPYGVSTSVVCPSFFRTNLASSLRGADPAVGPPRAS